MKHLITTGGSIKTVDFGIRDSWDFVEAMDDTTDIDLYSKVSAVFRAMNLTADATANLPFAVLNKKGDEVDTSAEWNNIIGIMPKPKDLIRNWRLSLFMTNTAYGRIAKTNSIKKRLFYVVPNTITIITDKKTGMITKYERKIDGIVTQEWSADDANFIKMLRTDHTTELLPSKNTEFRALSNSAGIIHNADWWTRNYFKNGAVRPTVLAVKGMVVTEKKEELQASFAKFMRGIADGFGQLAKVINAETMDVKQVGDGLGDIKDSPAYRHAIENIAMSTGIPLSLLLSNSSTYATATTEYIQWFRDSITPWAYWMQEQMNEQIFNPDGLKFEFRPEQAEPAQEEEVQRAAAFAQYVGSGIKPSIAAQIVGVDLPAGIEFEDLDPDEAEQPEEPEEADEDMPGSEMTAKAWQELDTWRKIALRRQKRGQSLQFEFKTEHIPSHVADSIRERLCVCTDLDGIKSVFALNDEPANEIKILADAINKAAEVKSEPVVNVTVNLSDYMKQNDK